MKFFDKLNLKLFGFQPTYSQCGEDVILAYILRMLKLNKITYVDIGTNHPVYGNNTYLFYRNGNRGINVEPNPTLFKRIKRKRKRDISINAGIAGKTEDSLDFYVLSPDTLSTFSKKDAEKFAEEGICKIEKVVRVPVLTINELLEKYFHNKAPDLISIDVEGLNEEIIDSLNLNRHRPKIFCIETLTFETSNKNKKMASIFDKFESNGYLRYADTYINTIFIDQSVWTS